MPPSTRLASAARFAGDPDKVKFARDLQESGLDVQLIAICGKNEKLASQMRNLRARVPMYVAGFTTDIPYFMSLSDFFIGKPGPGSISEAIAMRLPVIVQRNAWTLPQERYNTDWLIEKEVGIVVDNFNNIRAAVSELLEPARFRKLQENVAAIRNRAIFAIADILATILESGRR